MQTDAMSAGRLDHVVQRMLQHVVVAEEALIGEMNVVATGDSSDYHGVLDGGASAPFEMTVCVAI